MKNDEIRRENRNTLTTKNAFCAYRRRTAYDTNMPTKPNRGRCNIQKNRNRRVFYGIRSRAIKRFNQKKKKNTYILNEFFYEFLYRTSRPFSVLRRSACFVVRKRHNPDLVSFRTIGIGNRRSFVRRKPIRPSLLLVSLAESRRAPIFI